MPNDFRSDRRQNALRFILGDDFADLIASPPGLAAQPSTAGQTQAGQPQPPPPPVKGIPSAGKITGLLPDFERQLAALMAAVRDQGGTLGITSGFRDVATQRRLWQQALKKYGSAAAARKWVAPPGRSRHNKGVAADLRGDLDLAAKLAPQFGLQRPMSWEPWHFEPVGSRG